MAITQTLCTSFKVEVLNGVHNFSANTFKLALYTDSATIGADTLIYTTNNEVVGAGYTAGGNTLTVSVTPVSSGTTAYVSFANTSWASSTITARGALIYNSSQSNKAVAVLDFGADKTTSNSVFTITFPAASATSAIVRIS
jgi:hypothetical protein|tara:strand:- start:129 stop:551 length:423 start_codon:yes stop_codon:yes gene_type:complete